MYANKYITWHSFLFLIRELSNVSLASGTNIQQAEDLDAEEANKVKAWRRVKTILYFKANFC